MVAGCLLIVDAQIGRHTSMAAHPGDHMGDIITAVDLHHRTLRSIQIQILFADPVNLFSQRQITGEGWFKSHQFKADRSTVHLRCAFQDAPEMMIHIFNQFRVFAAYFSLHISLVRDHVAAST